MGSTLARDGRDIWSARPSSVIEAIRTLGRSIGDLELPEGLGDAHPNDGVVATSLMPRLHNIPGLWCPVTGYDSMLARLARITAPARPADSSAPPNLISFPYDWRLSNRYNAIRLKTVVESALQRWRESSPNNVDAKVIFVCHSMGGLIARWFIAREGGAEITRKLITLGTPYRGSVKALAAMTNEAPSLLGMLGVDIQRLIRSLPSVHQLLPSYACVENQGELDFLSSCPAVPIPSTNVVDATYFYADLERAESSATNTTTRHAIVGIKQTTNTAIRLVDGRLVFDTKLGADDIGGDGTVSAASGPRGVPLDDPVLRRVVEKHGNLQSNSAVLDEIEGVITSDPIVVKAVGETGGLTVDAPEIVSVGERFHGRISDESERNAVRIILCNEKRQTLESVSTTMRNGELRYSTEPLPPGAYTLSAGYANSPTGATVTSAFVVWPEGE
ncbi:lipase/acyltransferase domain-containing protein [Mycolicibacterium wolinskyi]|uniref:esterase/lipase family protein n=1 Tax=Mycolicibacterium wolinskyi TaxID=59750 RepID=UPI002E14EB5A